MQREELEGLELEKEVVDKVMSMNGSILSREAKSGKTVKE